MMKLLNKIGKIIFCACLVLVGILIGKFLSFPHFEISPKINLVNATSILVTVLIAVLITVFFDKRKSDNRIEKDLILGRVDNVYEITNELQKESVSGKIQYTEAASSIKRISTAMQSIYRTVDKCEFTIKDDIKTSIQSAISQQRDLLTDTPKMSEDQIENSDLPIEVRDGIIKYNRQRIGQIEANFDVLKDCLLELEIRINKK